MRHQPKRDGKYYLSAAAGAVLVLILLPIVLPFLASWGTARWVKGLLLTWRFRRFWGRMGRVAVLVYSDSPHWKDHIEASVLPRVADRVVTVNWSRRSDWRRNKPIEVRIFEHWAGEHEFNPMAIVVPRRGEVFTFRFWAAFRDLKHGKPEALQEMEARFVAAVEAA